MRIRETDSKFVDIPTYVLTSCAEINDNLINQWLQLQQYKAGSLFSSKDKWVINNRCIEKGDVVMIAKVVFSGVQGHKIRAKFVFLHEEIAHTIDIPVINWQAWFTPLKNED